MRPRCVIDYRPISPRQLCFIYNHVSLSSSLYSSLYSFKLQCHCTYSQCLFGGQVFLRRLICILQPGTDCLLRLTLVSACPGASDQIMLPWVSSWWKQSGTEARHVALTERNYSAPRFLFSAYLIAYLALALPPSPHCLRVR